MSMTHPKALVLFLAVAIHLAVAPPKTDAQDPPTLAYEVDPDFFQLPEGWNFGPTPGAAKTSDGHILIFTRDEHALLEFAEDGTFVRELAPGQFMTPHGLRVGPGGAIWVTDIGHQLVLKLDRAGRKQMVLGIRGNAGLAIDTLGLWSPLFDKPTDVAFDSDGNIYVSDGYGNSRVVKYSADGEYLSEWGEHGSAPGQFNLPHTIYVDPSDRVWVGDRNNHRIQIFDTNGNLLEMWDHVGYPWGFEPAADGNVWMADGTANRIVKLSLDGVILGTFGQPGRAVGRLGWAHYLTEMPDGSIIVAEIVAQRASRYVRMDTE